MTSTDLKPCPFCGGEATTWSYDPYDGYQGRNEVYCAGCKTCGVHYSSSTKTTATDKWNRRVTA